MHFPFILLLRLQKLSSETYLDLQLAYPQNNKARESFRRYSLVSSCLIQSKHKLVVPKDFFYGIYLVALYQVWSN